MILIELIIFKTWALLTICSYHLFLLFFCFYSKCQLWKISLSTRCKWHIIKLYSKLILLRITQWISFIVFLSFYTLSFLWILYWWIRLSLKNLTRFLILYLWIRLSLIILTWCIYNLWKILTYCIINLWIILRLRILFYLDQWFLSWILTHYHTFIDLIFILFWSFRTNCYLATVIVKMVMLIIFICTTSHLLIRFNLIYLNL